jgi:hypothetical protein
MSANNMLNPNDKVFIYSNRNFVAVGIAGPIRGFQQDQIAITYCSPYSPRCIDVDRITRSDGYHEVNVVTENEWINAIEKLHQSYIISRNKNDETNQIAEEEMQILGNKAEEWYNTLPYEQKKMIDALIWKWRPIAVA